MTVSNQLIGTPALLPAINCAEPASPVPNVVQPSQPKSKTTTVFLTEKSPLIMHAVGISSLLVLS
jgi:hypothetical protein